MAHSALFKIKCEGITCGFYHELFDLNNKRFVLKKIYEAITI